MSKIKCWSKVSDYVWKNDVTGMEVGIDEITITEIPMYELYGKMPNRLIFELHDASGGKAFAKKSVAVDVLVSWMRRNVYG